MPDDVKQDRWDRFMAHQQAISAARLQMKIGKEIEVLIDEVDDRGAVGRCFFDAPEIDGNVFIGLEDGSTVQPGDKIMCRVTMPTNMTCGPRCSDIGHASSKSPALHTAGLFCRPMVSTDDWYEKRTLYAVVCTGHKGLPGTG